MFTIHSKNSGYFQHLPIEVLQMRNHGSTNIHTHDFSELVIILNGSATHISPGGEYVISAGDVFVLHQDQAHGYSDTIALDLVNILFRMDQLALILRDVDQLPGYHALFTLEPAQRHPHRFESRLRLTPEQLDKISDRVNELLIEHRTQSPGWQFAAVAQFMLIVSDLCRAYSQMVNPAAQSLVRIGSVVGYIHQHYAEQMTLDDLARVSLMSRRTLTREFTKALGVSPIEYLIRERINRSVDLLRSGDHRVTEVAFRVGFQDSNYYSRAFRSFFGQSPRDFRKTLTEQAPTF